VDATDKGEHDGGGELGAITYAADGAEIDNTPEPDSDVVQGFSITADGAGPVTVQSWLHDRVFDKIDLSFADPDDLQLVVWVRAPWASDWTQADDGPLEVDAGAQVSFLAIPVAGDERLGGQFTPEIDVDRQDLVVPDARILAVQE